MTRSARPPLAIALGGLLALAAAMGLGRFLYTPALPMMAEGTGLGPGTAGLIATANFAGYLAGALWAGMARTAVPERRLLLAALAASAATTGAMALTTGPWVWSGLRAAGGVASALVLVTASALVTANLAATGRPGLSAVHFAGVGVGIVVSAAIAAPAFVPDDGWRSVWLAGGAISAIALAAVALLLPRTAPLRVSPAAMSDPAPSPPPPAGQPWADPGLRRLLAAYGCLGFGYVVTATFLVSILREGAAGRAAETWVWLAVGLAAVPSIAAWDRLRAAAGAIPAWRAAMLAQAAGVALAALSTGTAALAVSALALGGTFMGLTALGLAEAASRVSPSRRAAAMGLMTASFGAGQMLGPLVAGLLREATGSYAAATLLAAVVLVAGAVLPSGRASEAPG